MTEQETITEDTKVGFSIADFTQTENGRLVSNCGNHSLVKHHGKFWFPCKWLKSKKPKNEKENTWTPMVYVDTDFSYTAEEAVIVLNKVIDGTWLQGKGRAMNGMKRI